MSELVKRLRDAAWGRRYNNGTRDADMSLMVDAAADRIEQLEAENAKLHEWKQRAGDMDSRKTVQIVDLSARVRELEAALRGLLVRVADPEEYGPDHAVTIARAALPSDKPVSDREGE